MSRVCLYFRALPERDRWVRGDRHVRPLVRRAIRGPAVPGGVDLVFENLRLGLDRLGVPYEVNLPFSKLRRDDRVGIMGRGRHVLDGYDRPNRLVIGVGLLSAAIEWPTLCDDLPVAAFLQHSPWALEQYRSHYDGHLALWPAGIDVDRWYAAPASTKTVDVLIYDKIRWDREQRVPELLDAAIAEFVRRGLTFEIIRYGAYRPDDFRRALDRCRCMLFLTEHESQGLACNEAMAAGLPVLAWDQGWCLDPKRFDWGLPEIPATSVPFFDERCGERFSSGAALPPALDSFLERLWSGAFAPRDFVLEHLTLEKSARRFLGYLDEARLDADTHVAQPSDSSSGSLRMRPQRSSSTATVVRVDGRRVDQATLDLWYRQNQSGGWPVRWRRRPVWLGQIAQRLGMQRRVRAPLFFGQKMWVVTGEVTSTQLLTFGYSELALSALMMGWVRPGDVVVDVGAHFGYEALLAAHLVGLQGRVYAFEPNPAAFEIARDNLSTSPQCTLLQAGAADREDTLRLETGVIGESAFAHLVEGVATRSSIAVPVTTIDKVLESSKSDVRLIKCDAEGFEERVLRGARNVIARSRPIVVLEVGMRDDVTAIADRAAALQRAVGDSYEAFDFEFDGHLRVGTLGSLHVGHANIALVPAELRQEVLGLSGD